MKISIITCQNTDNHGAKLQVYALSHYLTEQGNQVKVIDYRPDYMCPSFKIWYWPGLSIKEWIKLFLYLPKRIRMKKRHEEFVAFSQKYIPLTKKIYRTIDELRADPPQADKYIAGSDQIWNTTFKNGTDPAYYLDFGSKEIIRESFAASFATLEILPSAVDFVKSNLKRFDKITVREFSGLKILNELGFNGEQQEDPVFLLSPEEWGKIADGTGKDERYLLVYDFYLGNDVKNVAKKIAKERNLKIYSICHQPLHYADKNFCTSGPQTFVSLVLNTQYIVSNSFHGTAFAIIFNKPFTVVDRPDGLNDRMHDLLKRHGIK